MKKPSPCKDMGMALKSFKSHLNREYDHVFRIEQSRFQAIGWTAGETSQQRQGWTNQRLRWQKRIHQIPSQNPMV